MTILDPDLNPVKRGIVTPLQLPFIQIQPLTHRQEDRDDRGVEDGEVRGDVVRERHLGHVAHVLHDNKIMINKCNCYINLGDTAE